MGVGAFEGIAEQFDAGFRQRVGFFPPLLEKIACCFHLDVCKED